MKTEVVLREVKPDYRAGFIAGLAAGVAMTLLLTVFRWLGVTAVNIEMMFGSLFTMQTGWGTAWLGFAIHLALSGLVGLLYVLAFHRWTGFVSWYIGTGFGVIHWLIAGVIMRMLPTVHTLMPDRVAAPGPFATALGQTTFFLILLGHLIFGTVMGFIYAESRGRTTQPEVGPRPETRPAYT